MDAATGAMLKIAHGAALEVDCVELTRRRRPVPGAGRRFPCHAAGACEVRRRGVRDPHPQPATTPPDRSFKQQLAERICEALTRVFALEVLTLDLAHA